jgi:hypothetical protein
VIHAPVFLRSFASDRSHMKDHAGNWIQLPPKYESIVAEGIRSYGQTISCDFHCAALVRLLAMKILPK